ncbi:MAG: aminoacyl-histidine dipeptidase [Bacteroidales bacterium]|nr:aminoacyl-histidine dipeptidase [Bacteroidales bacterium]
MSNELKDLQPQILWKRFCDLCAIPRPSKNESKAVAFVREFAAAQGLDCTVDSVGNVIIRKPATAGREGAPGVILQSHLDMVPQANSDVRHDFNKDPIKARVDGDWVKAEGTTLGADNGIGVAAALAVLEAKDVAHGAIEALFTVDEETGMTGANHLQAGILKGSIFINLDSEEEGELYIGCAGGMDALITVPCTEEAPNREDRAYKISLSGLKGGHSGLDIHLGRGNANKLLTRFLWKAAHRYGLRLSSMEGGNMRNAIPREASAVVTVPASETAQLKNDAEEFLTVISAELSGVEENIVFTVTPEALPATVMTASSQNNVLNTLYAMPNGVIRMIADKPDVVETSTNLAIVQSDGKQVNIACLLRSSVDSAKDDLANAMTALCALTGSNIKLNGSYPGWKPNFDSNILKTMKQVYRRLYRRDPKVKVIHAGLECGIFGKNYPDMDYVSFGPTIMHPHSPGEKVNIPSVAEFWKYLTATLEAV